MNRFIVSLFVLVTATQLTGQDIYAVLKPGSAGEGLVRFKPDGTELTVLVTEEQIQNLLSKIGSIEHEAIIGFDVDTANGKLYWTAQYVTAGQDRRSALLRSDLDGSNIEIIPGIGGEISVHYKQLRVVQTSSIPAVGNIGLGIMIATLIAAGGWVISRRTGFGQAG